MLPHQKAVCGIAIDPFDSRVLATAGNDGRLLVFDTRQSVDGDDTNYLKARLLSAVRLFSNKIFSESLIVSRSRKAFHAVAFHPVQAGIIVAANARNGAALWDLRKPKQYDYKFTVRIDRFELIIVMYFYLLAPLLNTEVEAVYLRTV